MYKKIILEVNMELYGQINEKKNFNYIADKITWLTNKELSIFKGLNNLINHNNLNSTDILRLTSVPFYLKDYYEKNETIKNIDNIIIFNAIDDAFNNLNDFSESLYNKVHDMNNNNIIQFINKISFLTENENIDISNLFYDISFYVLSFYISISNDILKLNDTTIAI